VNDLLIVINECLNLCTKRKKKITDIDKMCYCYSGNTPYHKSRVFRLHS